MSEKTMLTTEKNSLHGDIIKLVIKLWAESSMFKANNKEVKDNLEGMLSIYTPEFIDQSVEWNLTPSLVDEGMVVGTVLFIDENDVERSIDFSILPTGEIKTEYGE